MIRRIKSKRSPQRRQVSAAPAATPTQDKRGSEPKAFQHNPNPYRLYRVGRIAELLGVDRITVWRWSKTGVIPPLVRIGGISGLTEAQLQQVLHQQQDPAG